MKTFINLTALALVCLLFSSCERCMICKYTNLRGEVIETESCGNKENLESFKKELTDSISENKAHPECVFGR